MTKLNQIIAVEKGAKNSANQSIDAAYKVIQKAEPFAGIARTYASVDEDGEEFPAESTKVQVTAAGLLADASEAWTRLLDVTATKDWGNTEAKADVVVDGQTIIPGAPVSYLIWLEKQLVDLHTFIKKLPTLDPAFDWDPSTAAHGVFQTPAVQTHKSKKIPRNHVKAEATKEHPAQVEIWHEDVVVGYWTTTKFSGGMPATRVEELLTRIEALQEAVKFAREEANGLTVTDRRVGELLFGYLLA